MNMMETPAQYGWICPKCGAVMAPYAQVCVNCDGHGMVSNTITVGDMLHLPEIITTTKAPEARLRTNDET